VKTFLAIFTCAENSKAHQAWKQLDAQTRMQKGMAAQLQWSAKYADQIVYDGGALGGKTKIVDSQGIHDMPSQMGYFAVLRADSHDEAAKMFLEHPHFALFPGDGVEVIERIDTPRD